MSSKSRYSIVDRAIHNLAFRSTSLQEILADLEIKLYSNHWSNIKVEKPVFVTSLPRAGTTIILEALSRLPGFSTHTYRDMPFILTPVLWDKLSVKIRNSGKFRERAHGDGLFVSEDSPEAFEEIIWKKYFPEHYTDTSINLWENDERLSKEFIRFFQDHIKKIVSIRSRVTSTDEVYTEGRYISKNNTNIARTQTILSLFPDAFIIVPLRNPIEHAISLWRQHLNFTAQQDEDDFTKKYMEDIGHFEFGTLHRPILFPSTLELTNGLATDSLDYWIAYWISAFEFLSNESNIHFISYESLCHSGPDGLALLCDFLDLSASQEDIYRAAQIFNNPPQNRGMNHDVPRDLSSKAEEIYLRLQQKIEKGEGGIKV